MQQPRGRRRWVGAVVVAAIVTLILAASAALAGTPAAEPPPTLRDTGLYADFDRREVDPAVLAFAPQYPLWTDGASKRRWISLPPGTAIDASDPEAWVFPVGTRLWKEFSFAGRPAETRYIERRADGWLFAAYRWTPDGEAVLAPARGQGGVVPLGGGRSHAIPAVTDCRVCHESGRTPVIGFSLLQLSPDRDPGALHAEPGAADLDLADLVAAGLLVGLPPDLLETPPRIAARTAAERAALGYMHGNCGHCHNADGPLRQLGLQLRHAAAAVEPGLATTVGAPVANPAPGQSADAVLRIAPGDPERSALLQRIGSRWAAMQMPPLGTQIRDEVAYDKIREWIAALAGDYARNEERSEDDESHY